MRGKLDPRVNPYRPDLAAAHLRGQVQADRFVEGVPCRVRAGFASLQEGPGPEHGQGSQLLFGETFTVYEERDGWVWGQNATDGYVGWLRIEMLDAEEAPATHRLRALRGFLHAGPSLEAPVLDVLSLGALLAVVGREGDWLAVAGAGWVHAGQAAPLDAPPVDPVDTALSFRHTPYLWGGRSSLGIDCSGLVQLALALGGHDCPRDADQQQAAIGTPVPARDGTYGFARGDVVFFPGHVGIMADSQTLIHANAFHMATVCEPLAAVLARAGEKYGITAVKRLG